MTSKTLCTLYTLMMILVALTSCSETETYAEQKEREESAISNYITKNHINAISEEQFKAQGDSTSVEKNEYVFFKSTGIYMQIVDKGCGEILKPNESADVLCRFQEFNINSDSLQLTNTGNVIYATTLDKMTVRNTSGTFTATFVSGLMYMAYGSTSVPAGWLVPLTYIRLGRPQNADDKVARVKIIVPHDKGHLYATNNVYACHYEITYIRGE